MKSLKIFLAASAFFLTSSLTATAQDNKYADREETRNYPYAFVGVQHGMQAVLNGYNFWDVVTHVTAINAGAWFSPALGARVLVNGWKSKEGVKDLLTYDFTYGAAGIDAMINLTNAFSKTDDHVVNVILLGGLGANKAWGHNYLDIDNYVYEGDPAARLELGSRIHNHVAFQTRVGLMFDVNVGKHWSVNLEGDFNHIGSRGYAHEFNAAKDWQFLGMLGVTYKFGGKARKPAPEPAPAPAPKPQPKPEPKPEPKPQPKPQPVAKKESMKKEIFFVIARSVPEGSEAVKVGDVASWLKAHPTATATIKGYADKGTGNAQLNERYARERANNVAQELTEKYGIDASRLSVSSYGDTVQPMSANDDNRVVIVVAGEK